MLRTLPKFLPAGSRTAEIIAQFPWETTHLGSLECWPAGMKTAVAMILAQPMPIVTMWGEDGYMIYNDGYARIAGARHPGLIGAKVREGWPEATAFNDHVMKVVMGGSTLSYRDQEMTLYRAGHAEAVTVDLDYSPVTFEDGTIGGVLALVTETTARVRKERRAAAERMRLESMFQQSPGFVAMLTGPEHRYQLVNRAYIELVGHRDLVGRTVREAMSELERQGAVDRLDAAYRTGEAIVDRAMPFTLDATPTTAQRQRFLDLVYQPLLDESGEVIGVFVQGEDVTERVVSARALRERDADFLALAQAMPQHVWTAQADGQLNWFNDRVYEYTGVARGALDGGGWAEIIWPEDIPLAERRWTEAVASGHPYEVEFRIRRRDGEFRWHLARAMPILDDAGMVRRWIGTSTDIHDQKDAAAALARMNATLEEQVTQRTTERDRMWRLSKDIMLVARFDGSITAVSPSFTSVLGWHTHEVIGLPLLNLVHPDDQASTLRQVGALSSGAHVFRFENRYRCKDGAYRTLSWTASPDAEFIHAIGRDISAELERAEAMRRTEMALQQAQKMETIGKLTGGVAHDFNNLLQVISGNLQLIAPCVAGQPDVQRRVANALAGVERGAKLASYLLAFARRQPLEPKVVKVSRLITGMEDLLRRSLGEEVEVETVISGGLWSTSVDVAQVENALLNLAINARDAMDGRGKLTIEVNNAALDAAYCVAHPDVAPGQYVMIAVSDTGTGMAPEVLAQAFEPFFSTKPEGKGTGLGLSMVYGFVKQSGGHVKIYSEVGEGTTIKLYLPRTRDAEESYVTLDAQPAVGGSETILVVEDDDGVRDTVVDMLKELGYRVLKAGDASAALTVVDSGVAIDLLFTDVVMPGPLRSPDLARKAKERLPGLAVLFTSGYTENAIVHGGRLDAGVELIGKPYTKESLARKIRHVLAGEQRHQPVSQLQAASPGARDVGRPVARRIVLVEDEDDIRASTQSMLEFLGHHVRAFASAEEALACLDATIDVLITDRQLPGMSGEELIGVALNRLPALRTVVATGYGNAVILPGTEILLKPYGMEQLRNLLPDETESGT